MQEPIILGIDPGSRLTGYGMIRVSVGRQLKLVTCGSIQVGTLEPEARLLQIYQSLVQLIHEYSPVAAAIETVFVSKNAASSLKLGQARGAAIVAVAQQGLKVQKYSPREVKLAVTGYGGADKMQVSQMVKRLLSIDSNASLQGDAADALAVAICYAHSQRF